MVEVLTLVGSGISVLGLVLVAVITQSGNRRTKQVEAEAAPYDVLARRVADLEAADAAKSEQIGQLRRTVAELRTARDEDRAYIRRLLAAWSAQLPDMLPPQPVPAWYLPHTSQQPRKEHP